MVKYLRGSSLTQFLSSLRKTNYFLLINLVFYTNLRLFEFQAAWKLFQSFLSGRFQRVVISGQSSNWSPILAGVLRGSILGPLLFLVYINDLPDNLESLAKLFADDTSLFCTVYNPLLSAEIMNKNLIKISKWANQWKIEFNPDVTKQVQ